VVRRQILAEAVTLRAGGSLAISRKPENGGDKVWSERGYPGRAERFSLGLCGSEWMITGMTIADMTIDEMTDVTVA
jgi:hypothetical protein